MSTLGITTKKRVISRISFYVTVFLVTWILGALTPSESDKALQKDAFLGVAEIVIAKPGDPGFPQGR